MKESVLRKEPIAKRMDANSFNHREKKYVLQPSSLDERADFEL